MNAPASVRRPPRARAVVLDLGRVGWAAALLAAALTAWPARGEDGVSRRSIQLRVGETQQLGVWGAHRSDCVTSVPPNRVEIVQAPRLGVLSQRQGVPYVAENSISGTCLGARFLGTAVDYTARAPGVDTVALDPVFSNGVVHRIYSVTVLP